MPQDAAPTSEAQSTLPPSKKSAKQATHPWLSTPQPIKRLFDKFPLRTYPSNKLPQRSPTRREKTSLWIFSTDDGAQRGAPSFNPGCLKWQAYLTFMDIDFVTKASNNHASLTGALPFLLPAASSSASATDITTPVPSNRIQRWVREEAAKKSAGNKASKHQSGPHMDDDETMVPTEARATASDPPDMRYEAYMSLLDHRIRNAYLYTLYLSPQNFGSIAFPLYVAPSTTNPLVRLTLSHQLRTAAEAELLKQSPIIDVKAIYRESDKAFAALSELLGEDSYFFGEEKPGLFDASVFAYTNVLLDQGLEWRERRMREDLERYGVLVQHQRRMLEGWFRG